MPRVQDKGVRLPPTTDVEFLSFTRSQYPPSSLSYTSPHSRPVRHQLMPLPKATIITTCNCSTSDLLAAACT